ncbi:hypothetical protein EON64_17620 [archaeon]|nr:MAG: hypothetical protein EON64_17620 [archaeon]
MWFVQAKDSQGKAVLSLPHHSTNLKDRFEVQLSLRDSAGDIADLGKQKHVFELRKDEKVTVVRECNLERVFYKFENVKITAPGMVVCILDVCISTLFHCCGYALIETIPILSPLMKRMPPRDALAGD